MGKSLSVCQASVVLLVNLVLPGVGTAASACCLKVDIIDPQDSVKYLKEHKYVKKRAAILGLL